MIELRSVHGPNVELFNMPFTYSTAARTDVGARRQIGGPIAHIQNPIARRSPVIVLWLAICMEQS
jgi:hypothetical protein